MENHWCKEGEKQAKAFNLKQMRILTTGETTVTLIAGVRYHYYVFDYCPFCGKRLKKRWWQRKKNHEWPVIPKLLSWERGVECYNYGKTPHKAQQMDDWYRNWKADR